MGNTLNPQSWSTTAADNDDADAGINWLEGQDPGTVNNSARGMMAAVKKYIGDTDGLGTAGGTANALTITTGQAISLAHLADGYRIGVWAALANTSATVTINVDALGTKTIKRADGSALAVGSIQAGMFLDLAYEAGAGVFCATNIPSNSTDIVFEGDNNNFTSFQTITYAANYCLLLNRTGTDGIVQYFQNDGTNVGSVSFSGATTSFNTSSDGRMKENIEEITEAGAILDALEPVWFDWRGRSKRDHREAGFIAQALVEYIPTAVLRGDDNDALNPDDEGFEAWGVDLSKIVPLLVAEIKALRRRVGQLEAKR